MLYPEIAADLLAMEVVDQAMRERANLDPEYWNERVDIIHTKRLQDIIGKIAWPTVSKVGEEGAHAAWLIAQHAQHAFDFQRMCLALMKAEPEGEVAKRDIAYLEDRVRTNSGDLQLYGTHFDEIDGRYVPKPIENPEQVDERRRRMGLGTLQEGIEEMYEKYGPST